MIKINTTNILGALFVLASAALFILYIYMAAQEKEVIGLKSYYIWGPALFGSFLFIVPEKTTIEYMKKAFDAALSFVGRKK